MVESEGREELFMAVDREEERDSGERDFRLR